LTCSGKPQNQLRTAKEKNMAAQQSVGDSIYTRESERERELEHELESYSFKQ
jgi:hypothetical protein